MKGSSGHELGECHKGRHDELAGKHQSDERLVIKVGEFISSLSGS